MEPFLDQASLEMPRRPSDLARFVADRFKVIDSDEAAKQAARLRRGLFKYFVREVYPLSIFATWRYPKDDVLCAPRIGNQGFDAQITCLDGEPVLESVEITWPEDGKRKNEDARLLNQQGITNIVVDSPQIGQAFAVERLVRAADRKSNIDYGDASLLIVFDLCPSYFLNFADARRDALAVAETMRTKTYKARSVFLVLLPVDYAEDHLGTRVLVVKD